MNEHGVALRAADLRLALFLGLLGGTIAVLLGPADELLRDGLTVMVGLKIAIAYLLMFAVATMSSAAREGADR